MTQSGKRKRPARKIALIGIMAAAVECGKLALAFIPNVEVVTVLLALFGYSFGWTGVCASIIFVCIEPLIWGFGTWVVSYFLYWPFVALVFMLFGKLKVKNRLILTATAVTMTVWFGVLTTLVDTGLFVGFFDDFFYRFSILYLRGIPFFAAQTVTNAVLFLLLFPLLSKLLSKMKGRFL